MKEESPFSNKQASRSLLKELRASISSTRRAQAENALLNTLRTSLRPFNRILSFISIQDEIDLSALNLELAAEGRLLLPRREGENLTIYSARHLENELEYCAPLFEPDPKFCKETPLSAIECILVPGLGFDENMQRIGYGKGYYDRLFQALDSLKLHPKRIGVGFKEQLVPALPTDPHDLPLHSLSLF